MLAQRAAIVPRVLCRHVDQTKHGSILDQLSVFKPGEEGGTFDAIALVCAGEIQRVTFLHCPIASGRQQL